MIVNTISITHLFPSNPLARPQFPAALSSYSQRSGAGRPVMRRGSIFVVAAGLGAGSRDLELKARSLRQRLRAQKAEAWGELLGPHRASLPKRTQSQFTLHFQLARQILLLTTL